MSALYYIFAGMAAACAFTFLLAGIMGFLELERPRGNSPSSTWLLHIFTGGCFTLFRSIARHWRTSNNLRRLFYYALIAVILAAGFLYLGGHM